ncbi:alpha/beta hydrolase family protein [Deinococcus humi]|uniref:Dipeptidyl aminopeptidase/acylaminoacyl peptidase n=1 Tax=Deinococcus humi TaxID=662880 RepID=A0A7W8JZ47_9DEIO|nr:alpha/beta hydrolase [Deinococcus humi]MBB5365885.1 dipeptidyl aminopeptidase/acylaminoacyl peptidase [Deinococcus humi]
MTIPGLTLPPLPDAALVSVPGPAGGLGGYFWRQRGDAPAALLLHGWGQDASAMVHPARQLHAAGWHALSLSQRGWLGSAGCDDYGLSGPEDLGAASDWLSAQPEVKGPLVLLGFSMGGLSALLSVSMPGARPTRVTHVIAVSAPTDLRAVYDASTLRILKRCYDAVLTPEQWREGSPITHVAGLRRPALVVIGTHDHICAPEIGRQYAQAADSHLLEYTDMAHEPDETQWAAIVRELVAWVQRTEHANTPRPSSFPV